MTLTFDLLDGPIRGFFASQSSSLVSDVNKDWTCKDKDKDFTYSYLLQVAAKPTIAIKQQQWTQSESAQHMTVKPNQSAIPRVKRIKPKQLH